MGALELYRTERLEVGTGIMLDANEHYEQWVQLSASAFQNLNRYPDSHATALRHKLAADYCGDGIKPEQVLVTSGSIEAIDVLITAYKPDKLILNTPSYDVYKLRAEAHDCPVELVPLDDQSQPDVAAVVSHMTKNSLVVFITPNNPTGKLVQPELVRRVIEQTAGMVLIDEAYIEFAGLEHSMQSFASAYPNVIIMRTFSKAWGLAGVRLGYLVSAEANIRHIAPYRSAYSVNVVALAAGLSALDQQDELQRQVARTLEYKRDLTARFRQAGVSVHETDANFLVLDIADTHHVHQALRQQSILVRPRPLLGNERLGLRITIGSPAENEAMFKAVLAALG